MWKTTATAVMLATSEQQKKNTEKKNTPYTCVVSMCLKVCHMLIIIL